MKRKPIKILWNVIRDTHADRILYSFLIFVFAVAAIIWIWEPGIKTYGEALWYCYSVISTAGFGDVVATLFVTRLLSVLLTVYSVLVIAILTGVVVNFYTRMVELKNKETIAAFLDRIEILPELSEEELVELSNKVKEFRKKR